MFSVLWLVPRVFRIQKYFKLVWSDRWLWNGRKYIVWESNRELNCWPFTIPNYTDDESEVKIEINHYFQLNWWSLLKILISRSGKWGRVFVKVMRRMLLHKEIHKHNFLQHALFSTRRCSPWMFLLSGFPKSWKITAVYHHYNFSRLYGFQVPTLFWNNPGWDLPCCGLWFTWSLKQWMQKPCVKDRCLVGGWEALVGVSESLHGVFPGGERAGEGETSSRCIVLKVMGGGEGLWRDWEMYLGNPWGSYPKERNITQSWTSISQTKSAQPYCCALDPHWARNHSLMSLQGTGSALHFVGSSSKQPHLWHWCSASLAWAWELGGSPLARLHVPLLLAFL